MAFGRKNTAGESARAALDPLGVTSGSLYDSVMAGNLATLRGYQPDPVGRSLVKAIRMKAETFAIQKAVEKSFWQAEQKAAKAVAQGTLVSPGLDAWGIYDTTNSTRDKTGVTFATLRMYSEMCEPIAAIISKRTDQVLSFGVPAEVTRGNATQPGFRIKLTSKKEAATAKDQERIEFLTRFIMNCGLTAPPVENRRDGWQPGFANFLAEIVRDRLTLDNVAIRRWSSETLPKRYPIVAFAAEDGGCILPRKRELVKVKNFKKVEREGPRERTNTRREITSVRIGSDGGEVIEEFTDDEMVVAHQRSRTDRRANGHGFSEIEEYIQGATMWIAAREFNSSRFRHDQLPRGMIALLGNMTDQQFEAFSMTMKRSMQGVKNRWNIPIVRGNAGTGSSVQWLPFDLSPKDLEMSQTLFITGLWAHILYRIHPEETGFQAASPFRPPLSEASPETKVKYSQDSGLRPLLRWIEELINREILWKIHPDERYTFEFVGLGDYDALQDVETREAYLNAGLVTPKMMWDELDITMPPDIVNHPAANFPAPFMAAYQMLEAAKQQQQEAQQAQAAQQQQMAAQGAQDDHAREMDKNRLALDQDKHEHDKAMSLMENIGNQVQPGDPIREMPSAGGESGASKPRFADKAAAIEKKPKPGGKKPGQQMPGGDVALSDLRKSLRVIVKQRDRLYRDFPRF